MSAGLVAHRRLCVVDDDARPGGGEVFPATTNTPANQVLVFLNCRRRAMSHTQDGLALDTSVQRINIPPFDTSLL